MVLDPQSIHRFRPDPFDINTPAPPGMEIPAEIRRPAAPFNPQPMKNHIRDLIQRLRGQRPTPADKPAPPPPPPEGEPKSILIR